MGASLALVDTLGMIASMTGADTPIVFNVGVGTLLVGIVVFFLGLLAIVWKGKKEIGDAINENLKPINSTNNRLVLAINELQTIVRNGITGTTIEHSLLERGASPLRPTVFGAKLIKDSGLEKVLDDNKEDLRIKLKATLPKEYTEYDVQEKARELLLSLKDDQIMNSVKEYVYKTPTDIKIVLRTGGLWLRDDFLKQARAVASDDAGSR